MESKGQPGAAPATSPLLSTHSADPFVVFHVSLSPRHEIARGVLLIVGLGQAESVKTKIALKGHMRGELGPTIRSGSGLIMWPLTSASLHSPLTSSSHDPQNPEKMT
jgi:hypothetical protein